jgi:hypothetical protein
MMYPIPRELTLDGFSVGWNNTLSRGDKEYAAKLYPFTSPPVELTVGGPPKTLKVERLRLDRFRFTAPAAGRYAITVEGPPGAEMVLFGPGNEFDRLADNADPKGGRSPQIVPSLGASTYYLKVRYFQAPAGASYRVAVTRSGPAS